MKITAKHLKAVRKGYADAATPALVGLYCEMVESTKPKITDSMMKATKLIIDGNTVEEASEILGVSKVAVSQAAVKGLNRLAAFYEGIGAKLPAELQEPFNMPTAKMHLDLFSKAVMYFEDPQQSITWQL